MGLLSYRHCADGTIDLASLRLSGIDDVDEGGVLIGNDATWMVVRFQRGKTETLAMLRIDDAGPVSVAWESEPKAEGAWRFGLADFDHDGDPELHIPGRSFRIVGGKVVPWDGRPSEAEDEMCGWLAAKTGATACDPWLDAAIDERPLPDGTQLACVQEPRLWIRNRGPSAIFAIRDGHAKLLREIRGGIIFDRARAGCFRHFAANTLWEGEETLCVSGR